MGRHAGIANVETYRNRPGHKGQIGTEKDKQGKSGPSRDRKKMSLFSLLVPALSLLVPALSRPLTGIIGK